MPKKSYTRQNPEYWDLSKYPSVYQDGYHLVDVKRVTMYKDAGFVLRRESVTQQGDEPIPVDLDVAYTLDGKYIGDKQTALYVCRELGLTQLDYAKPGNKVVSIGFSQKRNQWFGWSHRAMIGFGIGHRIFEEQEYARMPSETPIRMGGTKRIGSLDQAKQAAINFANYVS